MRWNRLAALAVVSVLGSAMACGGQRKPPQSLVTARANLQRAKEGLAAKLDPTDVHQAELALQKAEEAWNEEPDAPTTNDLALIADRRALLAQSEAARMKAEQDAEKAKAALLKTTSEQLASTKTKLGEKESKLKSEEAMTAAQKQKLAELEAKLKDARDTIAKIAAVKDDDRGMIITLQGEVLFKTDKWDLKPAAMAKLDQIADALKGKEQPIVVYGYTDSTGTLDHNMDLSQKRAQSVRDYLVSKGIPGDLISAQGKGPADPVAENNSIEGRAQNRRVEIVVAPKK
jgi:outer membrane protein OmpA-like peptidoglycan-associated protein